MIEQANIRIFTIERLNDNLKQDIIPLSYTPRRSLFHPSQKLFYLIESDQQVSPATSGPNLTNGHSNGDVGPLDPKDFGYPRAAVGKWASCIRIIDIRKKETLSKLDLGDDEAAFSMAFCKFTSQDDEEFLVVGTGEGTIMMPNSTRTSWIHIYRMCDDGTDLEFIHKTQVEQPPIALLEFQGKLLAGVGERLRIYDIGQKQLLRKCELKMGNLVVNLHTQGNRIIVGDAQQSLSFVVYKYSENLLIPFADDSQARHISCSTMVDYETVAGGDKFGNIWVVRCPDLASEEADKDDSGATLVHERSYLMGAPHRLSLLAHFQIGDIPTSIQKTQLVAGGRDILVYGGLMGTIGCLIPFVSKEDVEFFQQLEMFIRSENQSATGRDHLNYRGYYVPVKATIDGDLCERFPLLPRDRQQMIAAELDRSVREVERKVSDMRNRAAF